RASRKRRARSSNAHRVVASSRNRITAVSIAPDGKTCSFGGFDKTIHVVDLEGGQERSLKVHFDTIRHLIHVPETGEILSCGDDGYVYDLDAQLTKRRMIGKHNCPVYVLLLEPS